jgi:hypothetical protein
VEYVSESGGKGLSAQVQGEPQNRGQDRVNLSVQLKEVARSSLEPSITPENTIARWRVRGGPWEAANRVSNPAIDRKGRTRGLGQLPRPLSINILGQLSDARSCRSASGSSER